MDVAEWLRHLELEQYAAAFRENGIARRVLPNLTAEDLKDLGISIVGHRRRLLEAIATLRTGAASDGDPSAVSSTAAATAGDRHRSSDTGAERRQLS